MKPSTFTRKANDHSTKGRTSSRTGQPSAASAEPGSEQESEDSPWVAEIESALSPYWSARLTR